MWEVSTTDPDKIFNWIRTNGESIMNSETPGPEFDHDNNRTRFFMFTDKIDQNEDYETKEEIFTTITSPVYSAKDFPLECFTFYYFFGVNSTKWKFHDFAITQILREIKFEDYKSAKSAIVTHLEAMNFDLYEFLHFL